MLDSTSRGLRVFLCHSSGDKSTVRELYQKLSAEGWIDVWLDEEQLLPGQDWEYEIERALDNSDAVIVSLSTGSVSKEGYVQKELRFVLEIALEKPEGTIFILPLRLDDCERPRRLRSIQGVDYFPPERREWAYTRLRRSLKLRGKALGIVTEKAGRTVKLVEEVSEGSEVEAEAESHHMAVEESENMNVEIEDVEPQELGDEDPPMEGTEASLSSIEERENIAMAMESIRKSISTFIPDFEKKFPEDIMEKAISEIRSQHLFEIKTSRVLVFGRTSVGKTTTINQLLESRVFTTNGQLSCTKSLACGEHKGGLIFYDSPGVDDELQQENITRVALGLTQKDDEIVDKIILIDITSSHSEGPSNFITPLYDEYKDDISASYYHENKDRIVVKKFEVSDFREWISDKFDFLVFVTSSSNGLPINEVRLIRDLYDAKGDNIKLFKVFNVFGEMYEDTVNDLDPNIKSKLDQAKKRLEDKKVPNADDWVVIDSKNGNGIQGLIERLADSLPIEVLRSLNQTVVARYAHLITVKLTNYFFDYIATIASLIAVFPVNYTDSGKDFLKFAIGSMFKVAEFMFPSQDYAVRSSLLDQAVFQIRSTGRRTKYDLSKLHKPSLLPDLIYEVIGWDFRQFEVLRTAQGTYFGIGGISSIPPILSLGIVLQKIYSGALRDNELNLDKIDIILGESEQMVESKLIGNIRQKIVSLSQRAGRSKDKDEKLQIAEKLYPYIRSILRLSQEKDLRKMTTSPRKKKL